MGRKRTLCVNAETEIQGIAMNRLTISAAYYYPDEVGIG
jgi:hypothetical protein